MPEDRPVSWAPFMIVVLTLAAGTMGATMVSPLFPLYETAWDIGHGTITLIYVIYMIGVLGALLFLGRLSDHLGSIRVLRLSCVLLIAGLVLSAIAPGPVLFGAARLLIGIASGLISTAATVGLVRLEPAGSNRAPVVASIMTMVGFGLGPLVSGLILARAHAAMP